jgi:hypothetical protein
MSCCVVAQVNYLEAAGLYTPFPKEGSNNKPVSNLFRTVKYIDSTLNFVTTWTVVTSCANGGTTVRDES